MDEEEEEEAGRPVCCITNLRKTRKKTQPVYWRMGEKVGENIEALRDYDPSGYLYLIATNPNIFKHAPSIVGLVQAVPRPRYGMRSSFILAQEGRGVGRLVSISPFLTHSTVHTGVCKACGREFVIRVELYADKVLLNPFPPPKKPQEFCCDLHEAEYKRRQAIERRKVRRRKVKPLAACTGCGVDVEIKRAGARPLCQKCRWRDDKRQQRARRAGEKEDPGTA